MFKTDVEHTSLNAGIISANEIPQAFFIKSGHSYNFVYKNSADGTWQCLDRGTPPSN